MRDARAKPLVCYAAFEIVGSYERDWTAARGVELKHATLRPLGIIYANGRDHEKQSALVISKRARISLSKVELMEFETLDIRARVMIVAAEVASVNKLLAGGDPHHFELPRMPTMERP